MTWSPRLTRALDGSELQSLSWGSPVVDDYLQFVCAWWRTQPIQTLVAVGADPAIERAGEVGPLAAIWLGMRLAGQLAHQLATFSRSEAWVRCGGDHRVTEQGDSNGSQSCGAAGA